MPSEYVPMTVNCWLEPAAKLGADGVTDTETSVAGVTVTTGVLTTVSPYVAEKDTAPGATPLAAPDLEIVATAGAELLHTAEELRFWVVPSLNVPVRVNCFVVPAAKLAPLGLMASETSSASETLIADVATMPPSVACTLAMPFATAFTRPVWSTVAARRFWLDHVIPEERTCVDPSE